ncbi:putative fatty acyl-CoA reductase CG5065 isoform X2 [Amblyomma americanum]
MATQEHRSKQSLPSPVDVEHGDSQVVPFYEDRVVFITGGTGFIGKVLLEKLLRSCPGVKRVYILVRCKRGEEPQARVETLLNMPVFDRLKQEQPGSLDKVRVMAGDLTLPNLGLSDDDQAALVDEVSVVFHMGATVRFDEPLKRVVEINVLGTRAVLDLCRKMSKLCALVHLSTAYFNWRQKEVHEMVYPSPVDTQKLIEATRCVNEKTLDTMGEFLVGQPNDYVMAKAVTESLLLDERGTLPVAIVRPSIVTASWKEPFPVGMGLLPSVMGRKSCTADLIPVDVAANVLICVAWQIATTRPSYLRVYNCTGTVFQRHNWGEVKNEVQRVVLQYPLPNAIFFPCFAVNSTQLLHYLVLFILRYLPAYIGDLALLSVKRQPRLVAQYRKVRKSLDALQFYTTNTWVFRTGNLVGLVNDLPPTDKQLFTIDVRKMNWHLYWDQYILGVRRHLFRADDTELPQARKRLRWLHAMRWLTNFVLAAVLFRLVTTSAGWEVCCTVCTYVLGLCKLPCLKWPL